MFIQLNNNFSTLLGLIAGLAKIFSASLDPVTSFFLFLSFVIPHIIADITWLFFWKAGCG